MAAAPDPGELCAPVPPEVVANLVTRAGFRAAAYLAHHPDLRANLRGEAAAITHFLHHGFAERRRFPIELDVAALAELKALPIGNRHFVTHLLAALSEAFVANAAADLARWLRDHASRLAGLRTLGAIPFVLAGDSTAPAYAVSSVRDGRWLLPIALILPGVGGMQLGHPESLRAAPARDLILKFAAGEADRDLPLLLKFGQVDAVFLHKLRRLERSAFDTDAAEFEAFSRDAVERYVAFLDAAIPLADRRRVAVLGLLPSAVTPAMWPALLEFNGRAVRERLGAAEFAARLRRLRLLPSAAAQGQLRQFNLLLRDAARRLGVCYADHLDAFLDAYGEPAQCFRPAAGEHHLDNAAVRPVIAETLWRLPVLQADDASSPR